MQLSFDHWSGGLISLVSFRSECDWSKFVVGLLYVLHAVPGGQRQWISLRYTFMFLTCSFPFATFRTSKVVRGKNNMQR